MPLSLKSPGHPHKRFHVTVAMSKPPLNPQRALHLRRCHLDVSPFSGLCGPQKQLGCKIPMRSPLAPRPQQTNKTHRVFQRRQLSTRPTRGHDHAGQCQLEIRRMCHARIVAAASTTRSTDVLSLGVWAPPPRFTAPLGLVRAGLFFAFSLRRLVVAPSLAPTVRPEPGTAGSDGPPKVPHPRPPADADDVDAGQVLVRILCDHCRDVSHVRQHVERRCAGCGHVPSSEVRTGGR